MIAIKGMEMPGDCFHCCFEVNNHCHVDVDIRRVEPIGKPDWCPLVELEPVKHGRWIPSKNGHGCECSECGTAYRWSETETMRYCKICGAKMNEVEE